MVGRAGSPTGIVHPDMTLTPSKAEVMELLKLPKIALGFISALPEARSL